MSPEQPTGAAQWTRSPATYFATQLFTDSGKGGNPAGVVLDARSLSEWERDGLDPTCPPHVAFAGNDHLVLGVSRLATLDGLDYDFHELSALMQQEQWTTVIVDVDAGADTVRVTGSATRMPRPAVRSEA